MIRKIKKENSNSEAWCITIHMEMILINLHVNEISFPHERMDTKTRFEKEAKGNSKMVYCKLLLRVLINLCQKCIFRSHCPLPLLV